MYYNNQKSYYKKSIFKWILIYVIIAVVAYGLIYYFFFANKGGYIYNNTQGNNYEQTIPTVQNNQDLTSALDNLDATDINQLESELNQNDADASLF